jgi:hypothetical protein
MAIAKFEVTPPSKGGESGGKSNTTNIILGIVVLAGLAYVGYKYVYLPAQARKEQENGGEQ